MLKPRQSVTQRKLQPMAYSDPEIIRHLNNLAVDAELSANYVAAKVLREAAARLTMLTQMWHPSASEGVDLDVWEAFND